MTTTLERPRHGRTNPAPIAILTAILLLGVYYVLVVASGTLRGTTEVPVAGQKTLHGDYVTLVMTVQEVDVTGRQVQATVLPVAHGSFVGDRIGEIAKPLRVDVLSGGITTSVATFSGQSIVDPTSLTLTLDRGDAAYPFDRPTSRFELSVQRDDSGAPVPFAIDMSNSAQPWRLDVERAPAAGGKQALVPITLDGGRDALTIVIVSLYVLAIVFTTLMAVVTIGSALMRRDLEFSNVIWLSATLLSFPALRAAMPDAPPIGAALDFVFLFPCLVLIAVMFVWTGAFLLWRESRVLRGRRIDEEALEASKPVQLEELFDQ
jgi:hypothetical protein